MDRDLHHAHAELDERHWWFKARRRIIERCLRRHLPAQRGPVLDVGCGAGGLLAVLARFGTEVTGAEIDEQAAAAAAERNPGARVVVGTVDEGVDACPHPTLATAFDVIEHVDDDVALLTRLTAGMDHSGTVCITVPALPILWSDHDVQNQHRRRYTMRTLRRALDDAGLDVVHISYFNFLLLPLVAAARLLERIRGPRGTTDFDRSAGPLDRVLELVFSSEAFVVPFVRVPVGVSLIAVARPRR